LEIGLWTFISLEFAKMAKQCDNTFMTKLSNIAVILLASTTVFLGSALAQDMPAAPAPTQLAPSATPSATAAPKAASAKAPQTGTAATAAKKPASTTAKKTIAPLTLTTNKEKASYAMGMNMGHNFQKNGVVIDPNILLRGLKDAMAGKSLLLTDKEAQDALKALQAEVQTAQQEKMKVAGAANRKIGDEFLAANKSKEGVVVLPSGLQYKILTAGTGPKPTAADTVVCNYRGTVISGTEFDSSYKRGQPATFPVGGVIKGWTEALQLMPVGSKWQLFIPADLAYGDQARGNDITPGSTLIFEVELISIQAKPAPATK
jgi:FKBP-type peptidyl-prolyl cis-trans isomerase FklB